MERLLFHNGAFCPWVWRIGSDVLATTHLNLLTSKSIKRNHPTTTNHWVPKSKNNFCLLATLCGDARKFLWNPLGVCAKTLRKHWWSNIYFSSVHSPFNRLMVKLFVCFFFVNLGCRKFMWVCGWFVCLFLRIPETFLWNPVGVCETTNGSRPQHNNVPRPRPKIKDLELCGKLLLIQYPSQVIRPIFSVLQNTAERFLAIGYKMFCHGWVPFCLLQNEMRLWVYE